MRPDREGRDEEAPFAKRARGGKEGDAREVLPLPDLQKSPRRVEAILSADWHLWPTPPRARANEDDWWEVQAGYLEQIRSLALYKNGPLSINIPVLVAGDIFDKPSPPVDFVNFVLSEMPARVYAVAGNHDLLHHSLKDIRKTAYWNLVEAGKIVDLSLTEEIVEVGTSILVSGYAYGEEPTPLQLKNNLLMEVALIHHYVWTEKTGFPGAPDSCRLANFRKKVMGYDLVVVGDNHKPFISSKQKPVIVNAGSLLRRSIDQEDYEPRVWLLWSDGEVTPHYLDVSKDKPLKRTKEAAGTERDEAGDKERVRDFIRKLEEMKDEGVSVEEVLLEYLKREKIPGEVEKLILQALQESKR